MHISKKWFVYFLSFLPGIYILFSLEKYFDDNPFIYWDNFTYQNFMQILLIIVTLYIFLGLALHKNQKLTKELMTIKIMHEKELINKNQSIEKLNNLLANNRIYNSNDDIWDYAYLEDFLREIHLGLTKVYTVVFFKCPDTESKNRLFIRSDLLLGQNVLKFRINPERFIYVFIDYDAIKTREVLDIMNLGSKIQICDSFCVMCDKTNAKSILKLIEDAKTH